MQQLKEVMTDRIGNAIYEIQTAHSLSQDWYQSTKIETWASHNGDYEDFSLPGFVVW
jgi:hypothetical protein